MQLLNNSKNMIMRIAAVFLLLIIGFASFGRQLNGLKPDDSVPRIKILLAEQEGIIEKYLDSNLDSLIILDFWATWCTGCISSIEVLDELQKKFENRIKVYLVNSASTGDDSSKINAYYKRWSLKKGTNLSLPSIIYDSTFSAWFPHSSIPHFVWIYKGKFLALSDKASLNDSVISGLLENGVYEGKAMLPPILFKSNDRLLKILSDNDEAMFSYSVLAAADERLPVKMDRNWDPPPSYSRVTMLNQTLLTLIKQANRFWLPNNMVKVRGREEAKLRLAARFDERFSYEMQDTAQTRLQMQQLMAKDIERRLNFKAEVTTSRESCIYIRKIRLKRAQINVNNAEGISFSILMSRLNEMSSIPIVQSSKIATNQSVFLKGWPRSESEMPAFLKENGIKVSMRKRLIKILLVEAK